MSLLLTGLFASGKAMLGRNGLLLGIMVGLVVFYFLADRSGAARGRAEAVIAQGEADHEITATVAEARRIAVDPRARGVLDPYVRDRGGQAEIEGGGG